MTDIYFMIGPTNVGKTTFAEHVLEFPGTTAVFVGKELRAKYGEDYFKGQAAPEHTEAESLSIMDAKIIEGLTAGSSIIMVDGQPRSDNQVKYICDHYPGGHNYRSWFLVFHCSDEMRRARLEKRDTTKAKRDLALSRFYGDMPQIYKTVYTLVINGLSDRIILVNTGEEENLDLILKTTNRNI